MPIPARTVASAFVRRLPGLGDLKLHKLLYLAQGHHLAAFGQPLFGEHIEAWEHGPVVAPLWREMRYGLQIDDPHGATSPPVELSEAELNTIGYVSARYGSMTGRDLEDLTHQQDPWKKVWLRGSGAGRITTIELAQFFRTYAERTDGVTEHGEAAPDPEVIRTWLAQAPFRRDDDLAVDDVAAIRALVRR